MVQKKLIIIGASSGIGYGLAVKYVEEGWKVGITARRTHLLQQMVAQFPGQMIMSAFDVRHPGSDQKIIELIEKLGGLDLLIYNAGYGQPSEVLNPETERDITMTSVNGFVDVVTCAFNFFVQQGYGHIALTSSVAALRGNSFTPAYSASKAFMSNYAEGLLIKAWKMKKRIYITDLRPGFIDTHASKGNRKFWVVKQATAVDAIMRAIRKKKRVVYITGRWWLIAQLVKGLPYRLYRRLG
jgi:short-subunit dehydrogenase